MAVKAVKKGAKQAKKPVSARKIGLESKRRREFSGVACFAVGIFCFLSSISADTGFLGGSAKSLLFGLMGSAAFVAPFAIMAAGVLVIVSIKRKLGAGRIITLSLLAASLFVIGHLLSNDRFAAGTFLSFVSESYSIGSHSGYGTGALGAVLAYPLLFLLGLTGSYLASGVIALCCLLVLTNLSIVQLGLGFGKGVKTATIAAKDAAQRIDERIDRRRREKTLYQEDLLKDKPAPQPEKLAVSKEMEPLLIELDRTRAVEHGEPEDHDAFLTADMAETTKRFAAEPFSVPSPTKDEKPVFIIASAPKPQEPPARAAEPEPGEPEQYKYPPLTLLSEPKPDESVDPQAEMEKGARKLEETLESFGISARVVHVTRGPAFTRFELTPAPGVKVKSITGLSDDIALNLAAYAVRIEAPIPGKQAIGIEIPNGETTMVSLREAIGNEAFFKHKSPIVAALGKDISGNVVFCDIARMPHLLIAGATGSGKSVCINSIIASIIYKSSPEEVRFIMIDPKVVELNIYNGIPHLLIPVVTDPKKAAGALGWAVQEMTDRYKKFASIRVKDIDSFNESVKSSGEHPSMPRIVIIIDELADLMIVAAGEVEERVQRLTQLARAAGIHLIIATQRPSVNVITGVIKANIPSRIAFAVASQIDSRTILGNAGAEKLFGKGDMLYHPNGMNKPVRLQGAWISETEVDAITSYIKDGAEAEYNEEIIETIESGGERDPFGLEDEVDDKLMDAIEMAVAAGQISTSLIQRKFGLGYPRAGKIVDAMEKRGIVAPQEGTKPRKVLITREEFARMNIAAISAQASAGQQDPPFDPDDFADGDTIDIDAGG